MSSPTVHPTTTMQCELGDASLYASTSTAQPSLWPTSMDGQAVEMGNREAERTDDILAIVCNQFESMDDGPKAILGDLNGADDAFQTLDELLKAEWTDLGTREDICKGGVVKVNTCQTNEGTQESRIDYIIGNTQFTQAASNFEVDHCGEFPTHRPISIQAIHKTVRQLCDVSHGPTEADIRNIVFFNGGQGSEPSINNTFPWHTGKHVVGCPSCNPLLLIC